MVYKKPQNNKKKRNSPSTVQHDSSANNAQDLGLDKSLDIKSELRNASAHRRGHSGSDGADQNRGSNH